jgi:autotransporter translocation and assembly factor TamB
MISVAWRILRGASVRSTLNVIGAVCAIAAALPIVMEIAALAHFIQRLLIVPP